MLPDCGPTWPNDVERFPLPVQRTEEVYKGRLVILQGVLDQTHWSFHERFIRARHMMDEWDWSDMESDPVQREMKSVKQATAGEPFASGSSPPIRSQYTQQEGSVRPQNMSPEDKKRIIEHNKAVAMAKKKAKAEAAVFEQMQWLP